MQVIAQKLSEMQATAAADHEAEISAMAELAAMTATPVDSLRGIDHLAVIGNTTEPLALVKARSEGARSIAESRIARAGLMPSLTANADLTSDGIDPGLRLGGSGLLGWGTKEELAALEATTDVVDRRTTEAGETAERRIVALERQIAQYQSQAAQGATVLAQTAGNLDLFIEQGEATVLIGHNGSGKTTFLPPHKIETVYDKPQAPFALALHCLEDSLTHRVNRPDSRR